MKHKKADRYSHTGKSYQDKEVYKNFLSSKFNLDKTEDDPVDPTKTNESSSEEEKIYTPKTQKKSTSLAIKDFVNNNWSITIIGGIVVGVIILVVTLVLNGYT